MPRFLLLFLLISMTSVAQADMYRWVDSEGRIHVSDTLPPAAARFGYDILTTQGRVIRSVDAPLTEEEEAEVDKLLERLEDDDDVQNVYHSMEHS